MIRLKNLAMMAMATSLLAFSATSCKDDEEDVVSPQPEILTKTYDLGSVADENISGTAKFIRNVDNSVTIELDIEGTPVDGMHPAHIHNNTAAETGGIALTLGVVDGNTGKSTITVTELDNGTAISYEDFLNYDGYINVHLSSTELSTIVAQGDIGQNDLVGESKTYTLDTKDTPGISGTAKFEKRKNGEALATIALEGTPDGGSHPAHIHANTALETGSILVSFNPVNGTTGISKTNIASNDANEVFKYEDVLALDGYINVHLSMGELGTIVAQGDIGVNELTGVEKSYTLNSKDVASISGRVVFAERVDGSALATIELVGTPDGGSHPAHIHKNDAATTGGIALTFAPVDGTTGKSQTNIKTLDDDTAFNYADVLTYDGYVNVHLSATELSTIVAQGNIGSNE